MTCPAEWQNYFRQSRHVGPGPEHPFLRIPRGDAYVIACSGKIYYQS